MMKAKARRLLAITSVILVTGSIGFAESGVYDRIGLIPEHGFHGTVPEENLDLFTGNLTLRFLDIYLPGPNGFDLKIWRVYNSKILRDRLAGSPWVVQQEPYSWLGLGWIMHMGRVHNFSFETPTIEFPDGRWETAYLKTDSSGYVTRDFLKYDKYTYKLYFKDGTVWTFGEVRTITYAYGPEQVRVVTRIENPHGYYMTILYHAGLPTIDKITDSLGREVDFITVGTTNPKLDKIQVKNAQGSTVTYDYTVSDYPVGDYYQLQQYDPPELPASTYEYLDGSNFQFEMTAVNTSLGGRMEYEYASQTFYFQVYPLETRVLKEKNIRFSPTSPFKTWIYTYPSYQNAETGTVSVDGPEFDSSVTYHAYTASTPWKIGLIKARTFADGSYSEDHAWDSYVVSNIHWLVLSIDMGPITAPLLSSLEKTRKGDAESKEEYLYERTSVKRYGLPTKINSYANESLRNYKTLDYYFETSTAYEDRYMLTFIWKEKEYTSGGTLLKETQTTYYATTGKFGAIDLIKRWKSGSTYLNWDYTYSGTDPDLITITINLPGSTGTETYEYSYGVLSKIERPGYTELSRTISQYDSSILSEINQHGGVMSFIYDGLGRITNIDMPSGFNDVGASWTTNSVTITQGTNTVINYWDGLGRDAGYEVSGDGITLYFRKTLDSEGRLIAESKGSTDSTDLYTYELTALGQVKKITDPRAKITNISYSGDVKTVTDPESRITTYEYGGLPGLVTKLTDAQSRIANHTYDAIGRLAQAVYNSARTQSYSYDGLDNITSETHPETGTISCTYSSENNLSVKSWGGTQLNYTYDSSNQLTTLNAGDETITYEYDANGRIKKISSTKSWNRDLITYNSLGSVTGETHNIPGLTTKTISYAYDGNNNLREITYPDGKKATYTNNGLNMPETATFDSQNIVSAVSYGYSKQPTAITISGNGTSFSASYNDAGTLSTASLKKGATTLYAATYSYDGLGNITSISNTTPQLNGTFGYDSLYRLTSAAYTPSGTGRVNNFAYTYDEYGNMTAVQEDTNTVFSKTYNSQNQISGFSYDSRGNLTGDGNFQYIWDNQNRLQELKSAAGDPIESYLYNERSLRMKAIGGEAPFSIFSFDGKLLSQYQYSPGGLQIRSYIYLGDRLIAEYRQSGNKLYYYTPDQINSVRMITDNTGLVIHSTAYDPYGGIEKTWVGNYNPILKFSGKERDQESGMDYFGARYYNYTQYRFNSSDPVIAREDAISNPQLWNLNVFCRNSPITFFDSDGRSYLKFDRSDQKLSLYDNSGKQIGAWDASNYTEKGSEEFPLGTFKYHHHTPHPESKEEDAISDSGFYGFDVNGDLSIGVHAGRKGKTDKAGREGWKFATKGCIRTTEDAMKAISGQFKQQDPLTHIVVQE